MFKTTSKLLSLFLLLLLSFIYTDKVFSTAKQNDPIMQEVISFKEKNNTQAIEPIINEDEIILGYAGISVNEEDSYKKMKEIDKFDKEKIVYEKLLPKNTISKTYEYYIRKGNPSKRKIAIIFKVNDSKNVDKLLALVAKTNTCANFFLDGAWLEKNVETAFSMVNLGCEIYNLGYNGEYNKKTIARTNNLIESIGLKDSLYCLNNDKNDVEKDICSKKKMHSIASTLSNPSFNDLKEGLASGAIISYDLDKYDLDKFILSMNAITNRGYSITTLSNILTE